MRNLKSSKAGFSLVELMVVVAIIGILASIAVPNFNKFQSKSRQSEAKANLSAAFTAGKTFVAEYQTLVQSFPRLGYAPDGVPLVGGAGTDANCPSFAAISAAVLNAHSARFYTIGFGLVSGTATFQPNAAVTGGPTAVCGEGTGAAVGITAFSRTRTTSGNPTAWDTLVPGPSAIVDTITVNSVTDWVMGAAGQVGSANTLDIWTINANKVIANAQSGL